MKKRITLLVLILTCVSTFAQHKFHFGPQISMNIAKISDMSKDEFGEKNDPKAKTGMAIGAFAEYQINNLFGVEADLMYSRQGVVLNTGQVTPDIFGERTNVKVKTHYINLPIKAKFALLSNRLYAFAGPQFGFCVGGKRKSGDYTRNINSELVGFDFSIIAGVGYQFGFGLKLGVSYDIGLSNVFKESGNTGKNRVFAITAGWRIK